MGRAENSTLFFFIDTLFILCYTPYIKWFFDNPAPTAASPIVIPAANNAAATMIACSMIIPP